MRPLTETRQADEGRDRDKDTIRIKPVAVFGEWQDTGLHAIIGNAVFLPAFLLVQ